MEIALRRRKILRQVLLTIGVATGDKLFLKDLSIIPKLKFCNFYMFTT